MYFTKMPQRPFSSFLFYGPKCEHSLCETTVEDICRCSWFPAPRSEFPAILSMISRSVMFLRLVAENEMEGPISFRQPPLPMCGYHLASPLAIIRATLLFRRRRGRRTSRRKHYFYTVTETQKQKQTLAQAQKGRADPEKGRHGPITPQIPYPNASGLVPPLRLLPHPVFRRFLEVRCMQMQLQPQPRRQPPPPPTPHEAIPVLVPAPTPAPRQPTSHASHTLLDFLAPIPTYLATLSTGWLRATYPQTYRIA
ncbi:hypothetical protein CSIM01_09048 [Colletotrichum simmondsii]|uniref:Uncharacterized protein n=1 Tax=Colletotrichum simmondsii TaxID=703756 RepID=A0A135RWP8_9PEZI|nr:hypothetical protein CSIM01_09048 [Colletotrichum simmondsii]